MKSSTPLLKQCFGIDISKDTFSVNTGVINEDFDIITLSTRTFKNSPGGIKQFIVWAKKNQQKNVKAVFVMEATGVYYETMAFSLLDVSYQVSVLLPNKVASFSASLSLKPMI
ncbi:MAG: IS110 family transposase [Reichenbachiella sp.]